MPKARVIIVNWNGAHLLGGCLDDLESQTERDFAVTIVDNGSTDESRAVAEGRSFPLEWIQLERNVGFAAANNVAIRGALEPYVALLNNDVRVPGPWLELLLARLEQPDRPGAVGSLVLDRSGERVMSAGDYVTRAGQVFCYGQGRSVSELEAVETTPTAVSGAACALRRKAVLEVGLFDERFFAYCEDVDLCLRLRLAGYSVVLEPAAVVCHEGGASSSGKPRFDALALRNSLFVVLGTWPSHLLVRHGLRVLVTFAGDLLVLARRHGPRWAVWVVGSWFGSLAYLIAKRRGRKRLTHSPHALDDQLLAVPLGRRRRWNRRFLHELSRRVQSDGGHSPAAFSNDQEGLSSRFPGRGLG